VSGVLAARCLAAALSDWGAEAVDYRLTFGVLDLLMLALLAVLWRRRDVATRSTAMLPALALDTAAFIPFLLAGVWTLGSGIDAVVVARGGRVRAMVQRGSVALTAAVGFGWRMLHDLRGQTQTDPTARGRAATA
jgi:hypothetical protein